MFVFSIADSGYRYTGQAGEIYTNPEIYTKIPENFRRLRRRNPIFFGAFGAETNNFNMSKHTKTLITVPNGCIDCFDLWL